VLAMKALAANGWCLTLRMSCAVRSCSAPSEARVVGDGEHTSASLNVHFHVVMQHICCSLYGPEVRRYYNTAASVGGDRAVNCRNLLQYLVELFELCATYSV